jgi:hypothetical protein
MLRDISKEPYHGDIQMAVNDAKHNGDTVYVPAGTHVINEAIRLPSCVSLVGDGYCSVIQLADGSPDNVIVTEGYAFVSPIWAPGEYNGETRNIRIANLRIRGNGYATEQTATGNRWRYVWKGNGIMLLAATDCLIENCWVENCFRDGILLSTGAGIDNPEKIGGLRNVICNCRVISCGGNGIDLYEGARNEASGGDFARIEGCFIEKMGIMGIRTVKSRFVRITNNTVMECKEEGIRVDQCSRVLVMGNAVLDGTVDSNGIKFSASFHCAAVGNVCDNNNHSNLELLGSQWCILAHNITRQSGAWGIISRTTVPQSGFIPVDILEPYRDDSNQQYQKRFQINTGHVIEGNLVVENGSGGINLAGTRNSIVAGNMAANNNLSEANWGVPGIGVGYGTDDGDRVPSVENIIADNRCYDEQINQTQAYGLRLTTGPNLVIGNNTVRNGRVGTIDETANNDNKVNESRNNR